MWAKSHEIEENLQLGASALMESNLSSKVYFDHEVFVELASNGQITVSSSSNGVPRVFPLGLMPVVALMAVVLVAWTALRRRKLLGG